MHAKRNHARNGPSRLPVQGSESTKILKYQTDTIVNPGWAPRAAHPWAIVSPSMIH